MKNEVTFQIEMKNLQDLISEKKFEQSEQLISRMLKDYNPVDHELLLKRSRLRQIQIRYEEASNDASVALNVLPQRLENYQALADMLIGSDRYQEALVVLEILSNAGEDVTG